MAQLAVELGRDPLPDEVANRLNLSLEQVIELLTVAERAVSLDALLSDSEYLVLGETVEDRGKGEPTEADLARAAQLGSALVVLDTEERIIIERRYGVYDEHAEAACDPGEEAHETHTEDEAEAAPAKDLFEGLSRRHLQQRECAALEKLRLALEGEVLL
jgi:RNA polymerase primary sigma factor